MPVFNKSVHEEEEEDICQGEEVEHYFIKQFQSEWKGTAEGPPLC